MNLGYHRWRCSISPCTSWGSGRRCGSQSPQIGSVCPVRICPPQLPWTHQSDHRRLESDLASGTGPCTAGPWGESDWRTRASTWRMMRFSYFPQGTYTHTVYGNHTHSLLTSLSVPTSITTGRHFSGLMPAQAVYRQSFPTGMPIPYTPRSPNPKMRSPSVTTTAYRKRERGGGEKVH